MSVNFSHRKRAHKALTRKATHFTAALPSSYPGIFFTAKFKGNISKSSDHELSFEALAIAARIALRRAAQDASANASPMDISEATDLCNQNLAKPRPIPLYPHIQVTASVSLKLNRENKNALVDYISARRKEGILELSQRQRAAALRNYFSDPALMLAWWINQQGEISEKFPSAEELGAIADTVKQYPMTTESPLDYQILDLLRAFVAEFPERHQKQAILSLMGNGFRRAGAESLAKRAESLAADESPGGNSNPPD